jgi:hypothetical protein
MRIYLGIVLVSHGQSAYRTQESRVMTEPVESVSLVYHGPYYGPYLTLRYTTRAFSPVDVNNPLSQEVQSFRSADSISSIICTSSSLSPFCNCRVADYSGSEMRK